MANSKRPHDTDAAAHGADSPLPPKHKTVEELMAETPADPPRRRSWPRKLGAALVVLMILLGFAPQIVSKTPLLGKFIAMGTTDLNGSVSYDSASLSWFSPPTVTGVGLLDSQGNTVATCGGVVCDQGLLDFITAPSKLGRIKIDRPAFALNVKPDGTTNLEQVIAKFLEPLPPDAIRTKYEGAIELHDGAALVREESTGRSWKLEKLNGTVILPSGTSPLSVNVTGSIVLPQGAQPWSCRLNWSDLSPPGKSPAPQGDIALDIAALPLEFVQAVAGRFTKGYEFSGLLTGKLLGKFDLAGEQPTAEVAGRINIAQFALGGPKLQGDQVKLALVDLPLKASIAQGRLYVEQCGASCDLAGIQLNGSLADYGRLFNATSLAEVAKLLAQGDGSLQASVDLAKIAQAMPHVLRVRDDVQITGGAVTVSAVAGLDKAGARRRQIDLNSSGLTAMSRGQAVAWPNPLTATLAIGDGPEGPMIEKLDCRSDFLQVQGTNTAKSFDVQARCSLAALMQRAGQFVDLEGVQLAGEGVAQGSWIREAAGRFNVSGTATIDGFRLVAPGYAPWSEQQLTVGLQAVGSAMGTMITNVESAAVGLKSGGDEFTLRTGQPSVDFSSLSLVVPVSLEGRGKLETWLARIRPFADLPTTLAAEGQAELKAEGKFRPYSDLEVTASKLTAQPLRIAGYGLAIDEPSGELTLVGRYTPKQTTISEAKLTSPGTQAVVQNMIYALPTGRPAELKGDMSLRTELARLIVPSAVPAAVPAAPGIAPAVKLPWQFAGVLDATAKLQQTGNVTSVAVETIVKDFAVGQGGKALWREPQVRLVGGGLYEPELDQLAIQNFELAADAVRLQATGKLTDLAKTCRVEASGNATYDLAKLAPIAQPYLGPTFAIEGRDTQPFQIVGPLLDAESGKFAWEKLAASARFGWDRMTMYGVAVGKTAFEARLDRGTVRTGVIEMPIGTGRVRISPTVRLSPEPMELALETGPAVGTTIDHIAITPEMVSERLKYVMPLVAGTTRMSGLFSVQLDECRLPLENPSTGSIGGRLAVHDVEIEPGPLMQELAVMLQQPRTVKLARESVVDFKMIQGRIYHQNLEFVFPETTIRTSGSVGAADQSLAVTAEVQVPAKLLGLAQATQPTAAGPTIRLPVGGTLAKPTLDKDAFGQSVAQIVQQVAGQAILKAAGGGQNVIQKGENAAQNALDRSRNAAEQVLGRGLNRLLGPGATNPTPGTGTR
jgi:translocation and assembly module TamB